MCSAMFIVFATHAHDVFHVAKTKFNTAGNLCQGEKNGK